MSPNPTSAEHLPNVLMPLRDPQSHPGMSGEQALAILFLPVDRRQVLAGEEPGSLEYHALRSLPQDPSRELEITICLARLISSREESDTVREEAAGLLVQRHREIGRALILALENLALERDASQPSSMQDPVCLIARSQFDLDPPDAQTQDDAHMIESLLRKDLTADVRTDLLRILASPHHGKPLLLPLAFSALSVTSDIGECRSLAIEFLHGQYPEATRRIAA